MHNLLQRIKNKPKQRGSSEILSLAIVLPLILVIIFGVIWVIQLGMLRQSLEYAVYVAGRAAVTQETREAATREADFAAKRALEISTFGFDVDATTVQLQMMSGTTTTDGSHRADGSLDVTWEKGAFVKITISTPAHTFMSYSNRQMTSSILMMVERPAHMYT